jgi:hypothetical protein
VWTRRRHRPPFIRVVRDLPVEPRRVRLEQSPGPGCGEEYLGNRAIEDRKMPLLLETTELPDAEIDRMGEELSQELVELLPRIAEPQVEVTDPMRLATLRSLLEGALRWVRSVPPGASRPDRIARVNFCYDLMVLSIELLKGATSMPKVPRARTAGPPP